MKNKYFLFILITFTLLTFTACNKNNTKTELVLSENSVSMEVGETVTLDAEVKNGEGEVDWTVSDSAVISCSKGKITALSSGSSTVKASLGDVYAECVITVAEEKYSLTLNGQNNLYVGQTVGIFPVVRKGAVAVDNKTVTVSVESGSEFASYSNGKIVGVKAGVVKIKAECGELSLTAEKSVEVMDDIEINLEENFTYNVYGDTDFETKVNIDYTALMNGKNIEEGISWTSSDNEILTVSDGKITVKAIGSAVITVSYKNLSEQCSVEIKDLRDYIKIGGETDFRNIKNNMSGKYIMVNDIDFNGDIISTNDKIGSSTIPFSGILDGNGYSLKNFSTANVWSGGFFWDITGTVKNLAVYVNDFYTGNQCGVLAHRVYKTGTVENVYVYAQKIINNGNAWPSGLISAYNVGGTIKNCLVAGNWASDNINTNANYFEHIAGVQENGVYENDRSVINAPASAIITTAYATVNITVISLPEIELSVGKSISIENYQAAATSCLIEGNSAFIAGGMIIGENSGTAELILTFKGESEQAVNLNGIKLVFKIKITVK